MTTTYWNGGAEGDFYAASSWSYGDIPQSKTCQGADVTGTADSPVVAVAGGASYGQINSLSVGDYGTVKITAVGGSDDAGYVFAIQALQVAQTGSLIIDTPSAVDLGLYTEIRGGTVTIMNNDGNVVLDGNSLNGTGTLNLINSTLGSATAPVHIPDMDITLQGSSTIYTGWDATGRSVTFDPDTVNTLVLPSNDPTVTTAIKGFSENARIEIASEDGVHPTAASVTANGDGSYKMVITLSNGGTLTASDIVPAEGFTPGSVSINETADGNYILTDANASMVTPDYSASTIHQDLQNTLTVATDTGSSVTTSAGVVNHNSAGNDYYTAASGDWSDASNWSAGFIPQSDSCYQGTVDGTSNVVVTQASSDQFVSLSVNDSATLTIEAAAGENPQSYVFSTAGLEVREQASLVVDTSARVELGGVSAIDGKLTIDNNTSNVIVDSNHLSGNGTLTLNNSTFGSARQAQEVDLPTVNLTNNSTYYASLYGNDSTINVDGTSDTIVLSGNLQDIQSTFAGVNANTHFLINPNEDATATSQAYSQNADGSYTLTIGLSNGQDVTLSHIIAASSLSGSASSLSAIASGTDVHSSIQSSFAVAALGSTTATATMTAATIMPDEQASTTGSVAALLGTSQTVTAPVLTNDQSSTTLLAS
ncbi:hypothetical protein [Acetobacter conturbans]|uniref:Uncharacterized protein n=1 Tax=Acetobacter conturbans TaxID=1737472 RepID=A0ABX0JW39_9PROT|nr:hypothetical protein [Acetobacter conturbans]NHN87713.1 hypothetical protein [Acetobacter conturbans]